MEKRHKKIPGYGYLTPLGYNHYRASAVAYMKREGVECIEHQNGKLYYLWELEKALIK